MNARELLDLLTARAEGNRQFDQIKVVVTVLRPGSLGGTPCTAVERVDFGFDWDHNKLMFKTEQPVTALTPEQVAEIHESAKKGQSWHAYEAHKAMADKLDAERADAERWRFLRACLSNSEQGDAIETLLNEHFPDAEEANPEQLDARADEVIRLAREKGLWPLTAKAGEA